LPVYDPVFVIAKVVIKRKSIKVLHQIITSIPLMKHFSGQASLSLLDNMSLQFIITEQPL
jgi:hypothetical protein